MGPKTGETIMASATTGWAEMEIDLDAAFEAGCAELEAWASDMEEADRLRALLARVDAALEATHGLVGTD